MEQLRRKTIRLDERDNVVVACTDIEAETAVEEGIVTKEFIPAGYKIASGTIKKGEPILKYNTVIGYAAEDIERGTMMHNHNILFEEVEKPYNFFRNTSR